MQDNNNNVNSNISFMAGAVLGALVGVVASHLLNPSTGESNRQTLLKSAKKYSKKGQELIDSARETAEIVKQNTQPLVADISQRVVPLIQDMSQKAEPIIKNLKENKDVKKIIASEQVQQLIDDVEELKETYTASVKKPKKPSKTKKTQKFFKDIS